MRREWSTLYNKRKTEPVNHRCLFIKVKCILRQVLGIDSWLSALLLPVFNECLSNISCGIPLGLPTKLVFPLSLVL